MLENESGVVAHAPYNFVPLPAQARIADYFKSGVYFKPQEQPIPPANSYHPDLNLLSGYFDCRLTTLTPLYIRATLTEAEYQEQVRQQAKELQDNADRHKPEFFSPANELRIPGSSLRGMIRTLVEIFGQARFEAISRERLFYRAVGDQAIQSIAEQYRERIMVNQQRLTVKAGCIVKDGSSYYICPAVPENGNTIFRVLPEQAAHLLGINPDRLEWQRQRVWFKAPDKNLYKVLDITRRGPRQTNPPDNSSGWIKGWLIVPGKTPPAPRAARKYQRKYWVICDADYSYSQRTFLPDTDRLAYRDGGGSTPKIEQNRFSVLPTKDGDGEAVPCFYIEGPEKDGFSLGHTPHFRLPYKNRPSDNVPLAVTTGDKPDIAIALFGTASRKSRPRSRADGTVEPTLTSFAGRVFFEDARLDPTHTNQSVLWEQAEKPRVLSGPKPTTFQHYLDQSEAENSGLGSEDRKNRLHFWDSSGAKVRGYKLYWHRHRPEDSGFKDWIEPAENIRLNAQGRDTQHTRICPVKPGVSFNFKIRFDNLTEEEVGVLSNALQLPKECAHKLGMAKPLGLGSVRLEARLYLTDRVKRYRQLFGASGWQTMTEEAKPEKLETCHQAFGQWLLGNPDPEALWEEPRLQELRAMLTYEGSPDYGRTTYMLIDQPGPNNTRINEYKDRPILPSPVKVIGWRPTLPVSSLRTSNTQPSEADKAKERLRRRVQDWAELDRAKTSKGDLKTGFSKFINDWINLKDEKLKLELAEIMWSQIYANDFEREKQWKYYQEVQQIQRLLKANNKLK
ncbi:MAG: TIGR03986 family CRISPR-associated RAMP protein [Chloroflexota bacterium]|nr:TIGR03986 family CRISPR-associated RAMP protein [Chloroflexota bacterium]